MQQSWHLWQFNLCNIGENNRFIRQNFVKQCLQVALRSHFINAIYTPYVLLRFD